MNKILTLFLFLSCCAYADSKYPVDVTYIVADLKYSKEYGVKICELQHGILSTFKADVYLNGGNGIICPKILQEFTRFPLPKWTIPSQIAFQPLRTLISQSPEWEKRSFIRAIIEDPAFANTSHLIPEDPYDISSYYGMIYIRPDRIREYEEFCRNHPGIVVIDAASHPYWIDKYKMSLLFRTSPEVASIKPEWNLYPKKYTEDLAKSIINEIQSDLYVIKPRGAFLGDGVIIVPQENLDATLKYIFSPSVSQDADHSYNYWAKDPFDSFLVEKFYYSDEIQVKEFENKIFQPTIRIAMIFIYNKGMIEIKFCGGYWMLPCKSLDEEGSLNQKMKAYCKPPFFTPAPAEILEAVEAQLKQTLPQLYQAMLEN